MYGMVKKLPILLLLITLCSIPHLFAKSAPAVAHRAITSSLEQISSQPVMKRTPGQSRAEDNRTWRYVGTGEWADSWATWSSDDSQVVIDVNVEECVEEPGVLRISENEVGIFAEMPIIHCENASKVYAEDIYYWNGYVVSQNVPENEWLEDPNYPFAYGTFSKEKNIIYFPSASGSTFVYSDNKWYIFNNSNPWTLTLPNGYKPDPVGDPSANSGVYLGITAFNSLPKIMPMRLLTADNKQEYKDFVNSRTSAGSTYLYYSVEQALAALKSKSYPQDITTVTMITFTDGNDDGSLKYAPDKSWDDLAYQNYIEQLISTAKVQGIDLEAYSIGLKGDDIGDYNYELFKSNLEALATKPKESHFTEVSDISSVETTLNAILDDLESSWENEKLSCSINARATGDRLRFTLDKSRQELNFNPENSDVWIEGIYSLEDNSLNDIEYHACTSTSGRRVVSKEVPDEKTGDIKYQFTFEGLKDPATNDLLKIGKVEYWHKSAATPSWQPHKEFSGEDDSETVTDRTSAAIMFVMDCSDSLGDDFEELKKVVNKLIDRLMPTSDDSHVEEVQGSADGPVEIYTLQGVKVTKPLSGVYIVKQGNTVKKVKL